jgi:ribosome-binding ATPase YchF (GTP1/OBG family)
MLVFYVVSSLSRQMNNHSALAIIQQENKIESSLPKIIKTGFAAIHLIYFFTAGEDECKCWTIRKGYKAPQAAGVIHGDFERGFICAEVMAYEELKEAGNEMAVKAKGRYRQEGKTYVVEDGDVIFFKCAPAAGPSRASRLFSVIWLLRGVACQASGLVESGSMLAAGNGGIFHPPSRG